MTRPAPASAARPGARRAFTALAIVFYVVMLAWGAVPGQAQQLFGATSDKLLHFAGYGLIALGLYLGEPGARRQRAWRTIALVAVLGAVDEAIQLVEPHRTSDWADWATDVLAAVTVAALTALAGLRSGRAARPS